MQNTQSNLLTLQQQISTGIALNSAGDNPSAYGQMVQLQQTQDANDQYQTNRNTTDARLTNVSSALTNLVTTLQQGKQTMVGANTSLMTNTQNNRLIPKLNQQ